MLAYSFCLYLGPTNVTFSCIGLAVLLFCLPLDQSRMLGHSVLEMTCQRILLWDSKASSMATQGEMLVPNDLFLAGLTRFISKRWMAPAAGSEYSTDEWTRRRRVQSSHSDQPSQRNGHATAGHYQEHLLS